MLFKSRRNEYVDTEGPVRYLDGSGLERPLDIPKPQIAVMIAFVVVAALIGGYLLFNILDTVKGGAARAQASVEENLSREVAYDLPALTSYIALSDEEIKQAVADAGLTVIAPMLARAAFGSLNYSQIYSWVSTGIFIATAISFLVYGMIYDTTGSFDLCFILVIGMYVLAVVLVPITLAVSQKAWKRSGK